MSGMYEACKKHTDPLLRLCSAPSTSVSLYTRICFRSLALALDAVVTKPCITAWGDANWVPCEGQSEPGLLNFRLKEKQPFAGGFKSAV